jgi:hypothetical protein
MKWKLWSKLKHWFESKLKWVLSFISVIMTSMLVSFLHLNFMS